MEVGLLGYISHYAPFNNWIAFESFVVTTKKFNSSTYKRIASSSTPYDLWHILEVDAGSRWERGQGYEATIHNKLSVFALKPRLNPQELV